jgi:hypothetical protein
VLHLLLQMCMCFKIMQRAGFSFIGPILWHTQITVKFNHVQMTHMDVSKRCATLALADGHVLQQGRLLINQS